MAKTNFQLNAYMHAKICNTMSKKNKVGLWLQLWAIGYFVFKA